MSKTPSPLTFETDCLELGTYCKRLETFLMVESDFVESSLVVSLNARFGRGKTTFIEMWKNDLLKRRSSPNGDAFEAPMPVILNAWESDYCGDPLVAILAGLLKAVDEMQGKSKSDETKAQKIKEAAQNLGWMLAGVGSGFTNKLTGVNPLEVANLMDAKKAERNPAPPDFIRLFNQRQKALEDLRDALAEAFAGDIPKVLVFVDELDRCRPDYAINYLETIKHVFNIKGMIFLLAIDAQQLEVSAKALFGSGLDFPGYFLKFCHRTFDLPIPEEGPLGKLLEECITKYITKEGKRNSALKAGDYIPRLIIPLIKAWEMNPRQLHSAFRLLGHAMSIHGEHGEVRTHNSTVTLAYLYLCLLRIAKLDTYRQFQIGSTSPENICKGFLQIMVKEDALDWIKIYVSGLGSKPKESPALVLSKLEILVKPNTYENFLERIPNQLGHYPEPLQQICQRIESAVAFDEKLD